MNIWKVIQLIQGITSLCLKMLKSRFLSLVDSLLFSLDAFFGPPPRLSTTGWRLPSPRLQDWPIPRASIYILNSFLDMPAWVSCKSLTSAHSKPSPSSLPANLCPLSVRRTTISPFLPLPHPILQSIKSCRTFTFQILVLICLPPPAHGLNSALGHNSGFLHGFSFSIPDSSRPSFQNYCCQGVFPKHKANHVTFLFFFF